jgi:hypothetical protein
LHSRNFVSRFHMLTYYLKVLCAPHIFSLSPLAGILTYSHMHTYTHKFINRVTYPRIYFILFLLYFLLFCYVYCLYHVTHKDFSYSLSLSHSLSYVKVKTVIFYPISLTHSLTLYVFIHIRDCLYLFIKL